METATLKSIAAQNPETANFPTTAEARRTRSALITSVKSPKVSILMGKVMMIRNGFSRTLTMPRTRATQRAVKNPSTVIPGTIWAAISIETVMTSHFKRSIPVSIHDVPRRGQGKLPETAGTDRSLSPIHIEGGRREPVLTNRTCHAR
jgi:hypothetical protein